MLFRITTLLSVFWIFTLYAELGNEFPTVLASTEVDEGIIYNHCVNAISGAYFEMNPDLVVRGPEPLVLYHTHVSSDLAYSLQGGQWRGFADSITTDETGGLTVYLHLADGATYSFVPTGKWGFTHKDPRHWDLRLLGLENMTNSGQGALSARNHPKNLRLRYHYDLQGFVLLNGAGEKKTFTLINKKDFFKRYRLCHEIRSNGNKVLYKYNGKHLVEEIKAVNATETTELGWIHIDYVKESGYRVIKATASDGQILKYYYRKDELRQKVYDDIGRTGTRSVWQENLVKVSYPGGREEHYGVDTHSQTLFPFSVRGHYSGDKQYLEMLYHLDNDFRDSKKKVQLQTHQRVVCSCRKKWSSCTHCCLLLPSA